MHLINSSIFEIKYPKCINSLFIHTKKKQFLNMFKIKYILLYKDILYEIWFNIKPSNFHCLIFDQSIIILINIENLIPVLLQWSILKDLWFSKIRKLKFNTLNFKFWENVTQFESTSQPTYTSLIFWTTAIIIIFLLLIKYNFFFR